MVNVFASALQRRRSGLLRSAVGNTVQGLETACQRGSVCCMHVFALRVSAA